MAGLVMEFLQNGEDSHRKKTKSAKYYREKTKCMPLFIGEAPWSDMIMMQFFLLIAM
jgi:hypothetical protein